MTAVPSTKPQFQRAREMSRHYENLFMLFSEADAGKIDERVVAVFAEACDSRELDQPALSPSAGKHGDDLDGLGDERARNGDDGFLDELFETAQRAEG